MEASKRILVNTIAQYTKAIINTVLSLYTVRLVLSVLGESDYGIMSVIGGIVGFLGFMTNAMVITTQRHLSYDYGCKQPDEVRATFSNSVILHLIIGGVLAIILLALKGIIVSPNMLNIDDGRWEAAGVVYITVTFVLLTTFLAAPFKALLIARENIVFISIIEVLDGILKVGLVTLLLYIDADKLIAYTCILLCIMLFQFAVFAIYDLAKFPECSPKHFLSDFNKESIKKMSGFAGWTTYATGVIICRNQGIAWLLNLFFGTVINAAYGIANQMFSAVSFISTSVLNAMNPQIMKAEGQGDREHMLRMAAQGSKVIVCMMALIFIPLMSAIDDVLGVWLKSVPPYTALFCDSLLIVFLVDQFTSGLNSANQAMGNIKVYNLLMYTPKLLYVGIAYIFLKSGLGVEWVMGGFIAVELFVALARLPYMHKVAGLDVMPYIKTVFGRNVILIVALVVISYSLSQTITFKYSFLITIPTAALIGIAVASYVVFSTEERKKFIGMFKKKK